MNEAEIALDNALVNMDRTLDSYPTAKDALDALIAWEIQIATDPRVNGGKKLVDAGAVVLSVEDAECVKELLLDNNCKKYTGYDVLNAAIEQARGKV
jgi:hypothetical protein